MAYFFYPSGDLEADLLKQKARLQSENLFDERPLVVVENLQFRKFIERTLAKHEGIFANVNFFFPDEAINHLSASHFEQTQRIYKRDEISLLLYCQLGKTLDHPDLEPLKKYLEKDKNDAKRLSLAHELSSLFYHYAQSYPEMIAGWENDQRLLQDDHRQSGDERWQKKIWQQLYLDGDKISPPAMLAALERKAPKRPLPAIMIFGSAFLSAYQLLFFQYLSRFTAIYHFMLLAPEKRNGQGGLTHWNKLSRSHRDVIEKTARNKSTAFGGEQGSHGATPEGSILGYIKNQLSGQISKGTFDPKDQSFQVISTWGKQRQVEILKDKILLLLEREPDLDFSDIAVVAPEMGSYVAFIEAHFRRAEYPLVYSIAATGNVNVNHYLQGMRHLLELVDSRFKLKDLLTLLFNPCCRRHFDLLEQDVLSIEQILENLHVRWGLSAAFREIKKQGSSEQGTWSQAIKRLLSGMTTSNVSGRETLPDLTLPYNLNDSSLEIRVGRLIDILEHCQDHLYPLSDLRLGLETWADLFKEIIECFLSVRSGELEEQRDEKDRSVLHHAISQLVSLARLSPHTQKEKLGYPAFKTLLERQVEQRMASWVGRNEGILFGDFQSLRGRPFKHIFVLGMNEGEFPGFKRHPSYELSEAIEKRGGLPSVRLNVGYVLYGRAHSLCKKIPSFFLHRSRSGDPGRKEPFSPPPANPR